MAIDFKLMYGKADEMSRSLESMVVCEGNVLVVHLDLI